MPGEQVQAGLGVLTRQILNANVNCEKRKHIAHVLVKQQNELSRSFYRAEPYLLMGWTSLIILGCNAGSSFPNTLKAK